MARFMSDRPAPAAGGQRYNREGLYHWAAMRFPQAREQFARGGVPHRIAGEAATRSCWRSAGRRIPTTSQETIDEKLDEAFSGTKTSEAEDAKELADWAQAELGLEVAEKRR